MSTNLRENMVSDNAALQIVDPADVGLSRSRLTRLENTFSRHIDIGEMPGLVLAVARDGRLAYLKALGYRDYSNRQPMTTDTLFWIASMTKPITTVAALTFHETGDLPLDAHIDQWLPEFSARQVAEIRNGGRYVLRPARRQPNVLDLLRHTSGIVEGLLGDSPVHQQYVDAVGDGMTSLTGQQFVERLASVPLLHDPGEVWHYGWGLDLLGLILERIVGSSLRDIIADRVFDPLGMKDTTFGVPSGQEHRFARPLPQDPRSAEAQALPDLTRARFASGGAGLVGTAVDFMRFALMLLGKGRWADSNILSRKTVEAMTTDQLGPSVDNSKLATITPGLVDYGFGLGVAVRRFDGAAPSLGSAGEFTWPGAGGTFWWADPRENLAVVFMAHLPDRSARTRYMQLVKTLVLQALT
ncbi:serine hydrolase domain-containing protein [Mycolicibacterium goodii]|uniref:serine hydrolase domain-containing protein n=1 Tax=Mycolicibacterium goodii TaxID=134601 RepID=UPI0012FFBD74